MIFKLVSGNKVLSEANRPQELDFHRIHGRRDFDVKVYRNGRTWTIARASFNVGPCWFVKINGHRVDCLYRMDRIVPMIRSAIDTWFLEGRYQDDEFSTITIFPGSDE